MAKVGRPAMKDEDKAKQFNVKLPPDVRRFLTGKENKSQLIIEAMRKYYKIKRRKRIYLKT